jgi:hypothetical protein
MEVQQIAYRYICYTHAHGCESEEAQGISTDGLFVKRIDEISGSV